MMMMIMALEKRKRIIMQLLVAFCGIFCFGRREGKKSLHSFCDTEKGKDTEKKLLILCELRLLYGFVTKPQNLIALSCWSVLVMMGFVA